MQMNLAGRAFGLSFVGSTPRAIRLQSAASRWLGADGTMHVWHGMGSRVRAQLAYNHRQANSCVCFSKEFDT